MIRLSLQHGVPYITDNEAKIDGFTDVRDMYLWMLRSHGHDDRFCFLPINKLVLKWVKIMPELYNQKQKMEVINVP
jgi:hypothetical protein